jgi:hypothetical protein
MRVGAAFGRRVASGSHNNAGEPGPRTQGGSVDETYGRTRRCVYCGTDSGVSFVSVAWLNNAYHGSTEHLRSCLNGVFSRLAIEVFRWHNASPF